MKNKKAFIIVFALSVFLATLCGCSKVSVLEKNDAQNEDVIKGTRENNEQEERVITRRPAPLSIKSEDDFNLKNEIVNHIYTSKNAVTVEESINAEDETYHLYSQHKVSSIPKFYSLDSLKIDGYKLYHVNITLGAFLFRFVPTDELNDERVVSLGENNILISINRWEHFNEETADDPLKIVLEQATSQGWGYLTEDDMLFAPGKGDISAQLGDTIFQIRVPKELDNYDYLRDLANQVIATAELVNVETELARLQ